MTNFILFAIGILIGSIGAIFLKIGSGNIMPFTFSLKWITGIVANLYLMAGFLLYFLAAGVWIYLMTKLPVSFVQPILALTYAVTPILAMIFLKEYVSAIRWLGISVIIIGVFIISRS